VKDYYCPKCGRWLFKAEADAGMIQTLCKTCRTIRIVYLERKVTSRR
jgi:phage FluMu protein Com